MNQMFTNLHRLLKPDKKFVLFIGDGIVKDRVINMSTMITKISKATGFKLLHKDTVPLKQVSRGFIKSEKIKKKKHHIMIFNNCK